MSVESITNEIIELNNKIKELEELREVELKREEYWYLGEYVMTLKSKNRWITDYLTISANYSSFKECKDSGAEDFLYLETGDNLHDNSIAIDIAQAKQLSDYLLKVINYMEDK